MLVLVLGSLITLAMAAEKSDTRVDQATLLQQQYESEVARLKRQVNGTFLVLEEGSNCKPLSFEAANQLREAKLNFDLQVSFQGPTGKYHRPNWQKEIAILKRSYQQEVRAIKRPFCVSGGKFLDLQEEYEKKLKELKIPLLMEEVEAGLPVVQPSADSISAATDKLIHDMLPFRLTAQSIAEGSGNIPEKLKSTPEQASAVVQTGRLALERDLHVKLDAVTRDPSERAIKDLANTSVQLDQLDVVQLRTLLNIALEVSRPTILAISRCDHNVSMLDKRAHIVMKPMYRMGDKPNHDADRLNDRANDASGAVLSVTKHVMETLQASTEAVLEHAESTMREASYRRADSIARALKVAGGSQVEQPDHPVEQPDDASQRAVVASGTENLQAPIQSRSFADVFAHIPLYICANITLFGLIIVAGVAIARVRSSDRSDDALLLQDCLESQVDSNFSQQEATGSNIHYERFDDFSDPAMMLQSPNNHF